MQLLLQRATIPATFIQIILVKAFATTPRVDQMEKAYIVARDFAAQKGIEIINATKGGALEVFSRVNFEDIRRT